MNAIWTRRSVRSFDESKQVNKEQVEILLKAAMQAPSAKNEQPWEFIVIDNKNLMNEYASLIGSPRIMQASVLIVIVANPIYITTPLYTQDLSAAMQNILLQAVELGLAGCWLGVYPRKERMEAISKVIGLPDEIEPFGIAAVGYPTDQTANHFIDRYQPNRVHFNKW